MGRRLPDGEIGFIELRSTVRAAPVICGNGAPIGTISDNTEVYDCSGTPLTPRQTCPGSGKVELN